MALRVNQGSQRTPAVTTDTESRHKAEATRQGFSMALNKEADQQTRQQLEELMDKIQQQGKSVDEDERNAALVAATRDRADLLVVESLD